MLRFYKDKTKNGNMQMLNEKFYVLNINIYKYKNIKEQSTFQFLQFYFYETKNIVKIRDKVFLERCKHN